MSTSVTARQISMGRGLRRTVDLFHSARDLVEENERRVDLEEDDGEVDLNEEYVFISIVSYRNNFI
jgi:hypothetical protein